MVGVDLSPAMVEVARRRYSEVTFRVGSLLTIPATDGEFAGAIAFYSIIHLRPDDRALAYAEMSRVVRAGRLAAGGVPHHPARVGDG